MGAQPEPDAILPSQLAEAEGAPVESAPALVIGGGPCGVRAAQSLSRLGRDVVLFNAEPWDPYNRVKLTPLLAGDVQIGAIYAPPKSDGPGKVEVFTGLRALRIDREAKRVHTADGCVWPYSALVLATGSTAFVPQIAGRERSGVFTFRDANDTAALVARSFTAREVVVIGGGLLGLEAARGMHRRGAKVTVVEHEDRLMPRQLDRDAAALLKTRIEALDVTVMTGERVAEIEGGDRVRRIWLATGDSLACDTVIICTGVRANTGLARMAGLTVARGVVVDERMRSSDPAIYAVGECAEHNGLVYGLVGPGLEQADVAAEAIAGEQSARYAGSILSAKLKVIGADVFSVGPIEDLETRPNVRSHVWRQASEQGASYRRIFIERGRLVGALSVGEWADVARVQQAVGEKALVYPWQVHRFRRQGALWREETGGAAAMPAGAIVCNCTGVTCGRIRDCMTLGASSLEEVRSATGANTVCGTCGPLIEEILSGASAAPKPVRWWKPLTWISGVGALAALATVALPAVPLPDSYGAAPLMEALWFDNIWKQWSGYILLGITVAAMILGLRRRLSFLRRAGGYDWWRIIHLGIGAGAAVALFAHTGFRFGANLTAALMIAYVATLIFGAVAGLATGGEHKLREQGVGSADTPPRTLPHWLHVLAIWPLPVLLGAHVLSIYFF